MADFTEFPNGKPITTVERELREKWFDAVNVHHSFASAETWQRRLAATAAYRAVYEWNRAK